MHRLAVMPHRRMLVREHRHFEFLDSAGVFMQLHLYDGVESTYDLGEPCIHLLLQKVYAIIECIDSTP